MTEFFTRNKRFTFKIMNNRTTMDTVAVMAAMVEDTMVDTEADMAVADTKV